MDLTPFLELKIAPRAVFDALDERKDLVRFMVPAGDGQWTKVTFGQFAGQIRELGLFCGTVLSAGDRAAIYAPNRVEWASASLAIQAAAGVMVPVYPASTAEQLSYVVSHSDAKLLFVDTPALLGRVFEAASRFRRRKTSRRRSSRSARRGSRAPTSTTQTRRPSRRRCTRSRWPSRA
jgi:long-chain acyl-CoA synthetase